LRDSSSCGEVWKLSYFKIQWLAACPRMKALWTSGLNTAARPLVDAPTCYSSPEGTAGKAHNIYPLEHWVRQMT